ncbi:MAG: hypothetical protein ACJ763_19955 [Bdellovibrionia bacterium]
MIKRIVKALETVAVLWGATRVVVESEVHQSEERAKKDPSNPENPSHRAGHELSDFSSRLLLSLAVAMIALAFVMHLALAGGLFYLKKKLTRTQPKTIDSSLVTHRAGPPAPRLQRNPPADYVEYHESQDQLLKSYGWTDRKSGIARIPVDRAMEILTREK